MAFSLRMHLFHWKRHVYSSISSWRVLNLQGRYVPNLTWKVVPICDHAELSRRMTLLWCTSGMCWFIFNVFPYWKTSPHGFFAEGCWNFNQTQSFLVTKSWYLYIFSYQLPYSSDYFHAKHVQNPTAKSAGFPRHMDLTSRRCCHRESLALQILHPQKTDGWNWTLQLHMMMWWNLPFPARSCSFFNVSCSPFANRSNAGESLNQAPNSGEKSRRIQNMEYTFIRRYKYRFLIIPLCKNERLLL